MGNVAPSAKTRKGAVARKEGCSRLVAINSCATLRSNIQSLDPGRAAHLPPLLDQGSGFSSRHRPWRSRTMLISPETPAPVQAST